MGARPMVETVAMMVTRRIRPALPHVAAPEDTRPPRLWFRVLAWWWGLQQLPEAEDTPPAPLAGGTR